MSVAANLAAVRQRIDAAATACGRAPSEITLVAVSKTQPASAIEEAYAVGQRHFGENYVQELSQKADALAQLPDLRWHVIGHLQRNKARFVAPLAALVHTVDTPELAGELAKRFVAAGRAAEGRQLRVLVEVNIAAEEQKHGAAQGQVGALLDAVEALPALSLGGLMCVPPLTASAEGARPYFEALRALRDQHGGASRLPELSMGMTSDLEQAVAAGATLVRVGSAIFGTRAAQARLG
ncbi:MAG TPA: YggS family pyridoxal phosphate-dependent enzyme [Polyangiaceae bacterium]